MRKPSDAQIAALIRVRQHGTKGNYNPFADEYRSFDACARKGLLKWQQRDLKLGIMLNGFALTDEGNAAIERFGPK